LVLAAGCGDSNGGNGGGDGPNPVERIVISGTPENPSFQGFAPDLSGMTFTAIFRDGTSRNVPHSELLFEPEFVVGATGFAVDGRQTWTPNRAFTVRYGAGVEMFTLPASWVAHGIVRTEGWMPGVGTGEWGNNLVQFLDMVSGVFDFSTGFQVHGANRMQQTYYVDEAPNFRDLRAEVLYTDGTVKEFYLTDMPFGSVQGVVHPLYTAGPYASGEGVLFITFGRHPDFNPGLGARRLIDGSMDPNADVINEAPLGVNWVEVAGNIVGARGISVPGTRFITGVNADGRPVSRAYAANADAGVTVALRIPTVHHVVRLEHNNPELASMFYWEGNSFFHWRDRAVAANTVFTVSYSRVDGAADSFGSSRTFTLAELEQMPEVWRNPHDPSGQFADPEGFRAIPGMWRARPFNILPVDNPWYDNNPQIRFSYRGHRAYLPVTVYQELIRVEVNPDWGTGALPINFAEMGSWDNDRWIPGAAVTRAQDFAARLTVTAVYVTRRSPVQEGHIQPAFALALSNASWAADEDSGVPSEDVFIGRIGLNEGPSIDRLRVGDELYLPWFTGTVGPRLGRTFTMNFGALSGDLPANHPARLAGTGWGVIDMEGPASDPIETHNFDIRIWYGVPGLWAQTDPDLSEQNTDGHITNDGEVGSHTAIAPVSITTRLAVGP